LPYPCYLLSCRRTLTRCPARHGPGRALWGCTTALALAATALLLGATAFLVAAAVSILFFAQRLCTHFDQRTEIDIVSSQLAPHHLNGIAILLSTNVSCAQTNSDVPQLEMVFCLMPFHVELTLTTRICAHLPDQCPAYSKTRTLKFSVCQRWRPCSEVPPLVPEVLE